MNFQLIKNKNAFYVALLNCQAKIGLIIEIVI